MAHTEQAFGGEPLMRNRNFLILWLGQLVSQLGDALFKFALVIWLVYTSGTLTLAGIMTAASIPGIIVGPVAGTLVDNMSRKGIIVFSDFARGALVLLAGWFMMSGTFTVAHTCVLLVLFGVLQPLFNSAVSSTVPNIVSEERLSQANSLRQAVSSGASLVGPALGAAMLVALGGSERAITLVFLVNGISYVLSGISELFLDLPPIIRTAAAEPGRAASTFIGQVREGIAYVWHSDLLRRMFPVFAMMNFFVVPLNQVVLPVFMIDVLALGEMGLGLVQSGLAAGLLLASIILSSLKWTHHSGPLLISLRGLGILLFALGAGLGLALHVPMSPLVISLILTIIAVAVGAAAAVASISLSTLVQKTVPDDRRGRVFAFLNTLLGGAAPVGLGTTGLLGMVAPLFIQPLMGGLGLICGATALSRIRELRKH